MPTYDYECTNSKCGYLFERFQGISEKPLQRCPKCRCKIKRLIGTGAGIIFKGSGFYETDYKRGASYAAAAKQDSDAPAPADKKPAGDAKADKPAAKPSTTKPAKAAS